MLENNQTILNLKLLNIYIKLNQLDFSSLSILSNMFKFKLDNNTSKNIIDKMMEQFKTMRDEEIDQIKDILDDTLIYLNNKKDNTEQKTKGNENIHEVGDDKEDSINSQNLNNKLIKLTLDNKYKRKRNYNQMLEESKTIKVIDSISDDKNSANIKISQNGDKINEDDDLFEDIKENTNNPKEKSKKIYPRLLDKTQRHYYYVDSDNIEWEFTEMNGTKKNYYFKCSTTNCGAF